MSDDDLGDDIADILSQGDIDSLMQEATAETSDYGIIFSHEGNRFPPTAKVNVDICDFRNPVFLTETEMRQVRIRHESFIHYMSARLSMFIRMDMSLKMTKLSTMSYEEFTESIPTPTFINLFRVDELTGVGIVSLNPRLAMTLVNRMLGGKGHSVTDERYLTDIEMALIEDAVKVMLDEWCNQWHEVDSLHPTVVGRENNGRFLQTAAHDAIMLVLDLEAAIGDCSEAIQVGVPYYMIDPLIKQMKEKGKEHGRLDIVEKERKWLPSYQDINVPVSAEWDCFEMVVTDLLRLRPGDVLELPQEIIEKTHVRVSGKDSFVGEVGIEEKKVAVKINEVLEDEDEKGN